MGEESYWLEALLGVLIIIIVYLVHTWRQFVAHDSEISRDIRMLIFKILFGPDAIERREKEYVAQIKSELLGKRKIRKNDNEMWNAVKRKTIAAEEHITKALRSGLRPSASSYSQTITACCATGNSSHADFWLCQMEESKTAISGKDMTIVAESWIQNGNCMRAEFWVKKAIELSPDQVSVNTISQLIACIAKARDANRCVAWFHRMEELQLIPNQQAYDSIADAFLLMGDADSALKWIEKSRSKGFAPGVFVLASLINLACRRKDHENAKSWFDAMEAQGYDIPSPVYSSILRCYCTADSMDPTEAVLKVEHMLDLMSRRNRTPTQIDLQEVIILAGKADRIEEAEKWLQYSLDEEYRPNPVCFGVLVNGLIRQGEVSRADVWLKEMRERGSRPDKTTYDGMNEALARAGDMEKLEYWYAEMVADKVSPTATSFAGVLKPLIKQNKARDVEVWLRRMHEEGIREKTLISMTLNMYANMGDLQNVEKWMNDMLEHRMMANRIDFIIVMSACVKASKDDGRGHKSIDSLIHVHI